MVNYVVSSINRRVIGINIDILKKIPSVISVVCGPKKALATLVALRTGAINILIIDESTTLVIISILNKDKKRIVIGKCLNKKNY